MGGGGGGLRIWLGFPGVGSYIPYFEEIASGISKQNLKATAT